MRHVLAASTVLLGLLAVSGSAVGAMSSRPSGGGGVGQGGPPPRAKLERFVCRTARHPRRRRISVRAVMRARPTPSRMAIKFELLLRARGASDYTRLYGGDLGRWRHPTDPTTLGQRPDDVWRLTETVANLTAHGDYRFRVKFRWKGRSGRELQRTTLLSPRCRQR